MNLLPCKNSLTGEHEWLVRVGKNADKPEQCILCKQLKCDIEQADNSIRRADMKMIDDVPEPQDGIQKGISDDFHKHLDGCKQCRDNPMFLCRAGAELLGLAACAGQDNKGGDNG